MSETKGHVKQGRRELCARMALVWAALALALALPACSKEAEETKAEREPKAVHAFLEVDERAAQRAAAEFARRQFLLGETERERQRAFQELNRLDSAEAWILEVSTAGELAEERDELKAQLARQQFLLGKTNEERQRALAELKRLDPDEAEDLEGLDAGELPDERKEVAMEEAQLKFLAAKTNEERQRAYEEIKRLDPEAAKDLLE